MQSIYIPHQSFYIYSVIYSIHTFLSTLFIPCHPLYFYLLSILFLPFIHFILFFNLFIHIIYTLLCTVFVLCYALYLCLLSTLFISRELPSLYLVITFFTVTLFAVPIPYHPLYVSIYFILSLLSTLFIPCQLHLKKK